MPVSVEHRYIVRDSKGKDSPPTPESHIIDLARRGYIQPRTAIRQVGMPHFVLAAELPFLVPVFGAAVAQAAVRVSAPTQAFAPPPSALRRPQAVPTEPSGSFQAPMPEPPREAPLPPFLPENAPTQVLYSVREYGRQYNSATWMIIAYVGLLVLSPIIGLILWPLGLVTALLLPGVVFAALFFHVVMFCMALYGFFLKPALRRKVAEMGIDPDLWRQHIGRDFQRASQPLFLAIAMVMGLAFASGVGLCILALIQRPNR